jgi:3-oxoacyl-[acyl-carrier protein] reductase
MNEDLAPRLAELDLRGQTAVVTGASSGIGRQIAVRLAAAGANCLIHAGQNESGARQVAAAVEASGVNAHVVMADLGDTRQQDRLCDEALSWRDTIDIWVNNAGVDVLTGEASERSFEEKLDLLWKVDVVATIRLSRMIGRSMQATGTGTILNLGWDQAEFGMGGDSGEMFATIKGAVMAYTRSLACSLAPEVRVNCIAPGWIRTQWGEQASEYWQQRAESESLMKRWGTPDDVARVAQFLVSPAASFITGQCVPVNGGWRGA